MNECKGILGKWLGHKFVKYLIKDKYSPHPNMEIKAIGFEAMTYLCEIQRNVYEIRCKRCGCKPDEIKRGWNVGDN